MPTQFDLKTWTPQLLLPDDPRDTSGFATMLVEIDRCSTCQQWMVNLAPRLRSAVGRAPFPLWHALAVEEQARRAGLRLQSIARAGNDDDHYICMTCQAEGKAFIVCAHCKQQRSADDIQEGFGMGDRDYLCTHCYATTPARLWDRLRDELREQHRYDYD